MPFCTVPEALEEIRRGQLLILVDDEDRENEGDLVLAAETVTPEAINFMARFGRGLICLCLTEEKADELELPLMVPDNTSRFGTAFTVSIEAKRGVSTGISAFDRAHTILTAIRPDAKPGDLVRPGHVFPLRAKRGGVLVRTGQTEGSVDLAKMAGLNPSAVICEIMNDDGSMARLPQLMNFAKTHGLKICSVADIVQYRRQHEKLVERLETVRLPSKFGDFNLTVYRSLVDRLPHVAVHKNIEIPAAFETPCQTLEEPVMVRVHSECLTGDVFGSQRCDCGEQIGRAMNMVEKEGKGIVLYMRQEGRGIGLENKIKAYSLQEKGMDTVEANAALGFKPDHRDYGIGAQILRDLGVQRLKLLTNNPRKMVALEGYGLQIAERIPLETAPEPFNEFYLRTKKEKLGHWLGHA